MKCVLEHCEFANGGHCALVCPKKLVLQQQRNVQAEKIEACVKMLRRVYNRKEGRSLCKRELPVGVYYSRNWYSAHIGYNGKKITLGCSKNVDDVLKLRADAEKARDEGTLDEFVRKLRADRKKAKKANKTAEKGRGKR